MKLFISDQRPNFPKLLQELKQYPISDYRLDKLNEKISTIPLSHFPSNPHILFSYQIFPPHIMSYYTEWQHENRSIREGDTILQQVFLPPFRGISFKLLFGVRIKEIFNEPDKLGFSYETLEGHVEKGISNFCFERSGTEVQFNIHTFSTPGIFLSRIAGPFFTAPYQNYVTQKALAHVKEQLESRT